MTANHQAILAELYEIDPSLREHEAELLPLVQKLLANDPAQKPSPAFVKKLRSELAARMNAMANSAVEHRVSYAPPLGFIQRFAYAFAGAVAAVVIAVPITLQWVENGGVPVITPTSDEATDEGTDMYRKNDKAVSNEAPSPVGNTPVPSAMGRPQAGGGGGVSIDGTMTMNAVSSLIAPWNPVRYRIVGELPALPQGDIEILRPNRQPISATFASIANAFTIDSIDLSTFKNTNIEMITISQNQAFGYSISLSLMDGSVTISEQWNQWPHPENSCMDEVCHRKYQPTLSDIPSDSHLIRIAEEFFDKHGIDRSGYGDPVVEDTWQISYVATGGESPWVPSAITVMYPLMIDGKTVMESSGGHAGISVAISVREKKVSGVWGLTTQSFSREKHPAVSDAADIEQFISLTGSQTPDAALATLHNARIGYVRLYSYEINEQKEIIVPAMIFDVTAPEGSPYVPRTIAVPLSKTLLDEAEPPIMIDPMPMPLEGGPAIDVPTEEPPQMEKALY